MRFILLSVTFLSILHAETVREFKDTQGRALKAELITANDKEASLKLSNQSTVVIPLEKLSTADQDYIKKFLSENANAAKKVNDALGFPAFSSEGFTERDAADIAKAMKLPQESSSTIGSSWRLYAAVQRKGYELFGAVPYSVALYSDENKKASSLSIVFANKGDYGSTAGFAQDHFKSKGVEPPSSLESAMQMDYDQIKKTLTTALGEGKEQRYGDTKVRRKALRWDWNNHSFILSLVENEYVSILVVPTKLADAGGRSDKVSDKVVRERLLKSLVKKDNGDVIVSNIPMVNQGPKGYCVPATFERAMRFMGIESDMYLIAMVGQTGVGGGTVVEILMENLRSQVFSKGRRLKEIPVKELNVREVKRIIDTGVPILWRMCSTETYNKVTNENTESRSKADHAAWIKEQVEKFSNKSKEEENYHMCLIIGYNEKTQELAVSDSWGDRFEIRWTPVEVANWASNGMLVVIQP